MNDRGFHQGTNCGRSRDTVPVNRAGRFSRNATTPSVASGFLPSAKTPLLSILCASIGWSAPSIRQSICRMSAMDTGAALSTISRARAWATDIRSDGSCRERTSPCSSASVAGNTRPEKHHSSARLVRSRTEAVAKHLGQARPRREATSIP